MWQTSSIVFCGKDEANRKRLEFSKEKYNQIVFREVITVATIGKRPGKRLISDFPQNPSGSGRF
jgi:hypothetical protein